MPTLLDSLVYTNLTFFFLFFFVEMITNIVPIILEQRKVFKKQCEQQPDNQPVSKTIIVII